MAAEPPAVVWNKPSGGGATGHVIAGDDSWPALSEATRNQPKSAVDPPPVPASRGHLISNLKKNERQNHSNTNQNHKHSTNQITTPAGQRSKRGGGSGGGPSQNGIGHHPRPLSLPRPQRLAAPRTPPPPPPPPLPPLPIYEGSFGPLPPIMPLGIPPSFSGNNWERRPVVGFSPQPTPVNDQYFQRNSNTRGSYAGRPRGDGVANSGHMSRRDHHRDRTASHKGFARPSRSQVPAPPPLPFFPMPSLRPFPDPIDFGTASHYLNFPTPPPEFFMRFPPPAPHPFVVPPMVPDLPSLLIRQIDHYFSDDNLAKDAYLRSRMDDEGWVDIAFIADFPMVKRMTPNLQLILDSVRDSTVVEVQGNCIRRRNDWRKWLISVPRSSTGFSSPAQVGSAEKMLTESLENVILEDEISCDGKTGSSSNLAHSDMGN